MHADPTFFLHATNQSLIRYAGQRDDEIICQWCTASADADAATMPRSRCAAVASKIRRGPDEADFSATASDAQGAASPFDSRFGASKDGAYVSSFTLCLAARRAGACAAWSNTSSARLQVYMALTLTAAACIACTSQSSSRCAALMFIVAWAKKSNDGSARGCASCVRAVNVLT